MFKTINLRLVATIALIGGAAPFASAQGIGTTQEAIAVIKDSSEVTLSDAARLSGLRLARFANGSQQWKVYVFDEGQEHVFEIQSADRLRVSSSDRDRMINDAFWNNLPELDDTEDPFVFLERATADLEADDATLTPRDKFIIEYAVCDPAVSGRPASPDGCALGGILNSWSVILQADQSDGGWINRMVTYEDGQLNEITGARVGGNW